MAEEETEEQEEEAVPVAPSAPPPSLLKYLPVVLVVLLLQAGGAYYVVDKYFLKTDQMGLLIAEDDTGRPRTIPEGDEPEASVDLGEVIVNPRSHGARLLVRAEVTLGVAPDDAAGEIKSDLNIDRVRDAVIFELGYATPEELNSREGREVVKDRMKKRINNYLYEGQVVQVYFSSFLMQAMSGYKGQ